MTIFDQRGQRVNYQYNVAGDLNFGGVQNSVDLIAELEKLQAEVQRAVEGGTFDEETGTDVEYRVTKAVQEAKKVKPDKKTLLDHLDSAKELMVGSAVTATAVTGLITAITQAAELIQRFF